VTGVQTCALPIYPPFANHIEQFVIGGIAGRDVPGARSVGRALLEGPRLDGKRRTKAGNRVLLADCLIEGSRKFAGSSPLAAESVDQHGVDSSQIDGQVGIDLMGGTFITLFVLERAEGGGLDGTQVDRL